MRARRPRVLLVTPPMMQLNTAYPAIPMLTGFLRSRGCEVAQADAALELALRLFSRPGLNAIRDAVAARDSARVHPPALRHFLAHGDAYADTVEAAVAFLQSREPALAARIVTRRFLPEGPRFDVIAQWDRALRGGGLNSKEPLLDWRFGELGVQDRARYLASLYVDDLADVIRLGVDERFELSRYAEKLALSLSTFEPLRRALNEPASLVDRFIEDIAVDLFAAHRPDLVGFTVPFPGNLYAALRMARRMKQVAPSVRIVLGGGYVNTELRSLKDPGIFELVDFITLDDGEQPLWRLVERLARPADSGALVRTFTGENGRVVFHRGEAAGCGEPVACDPVYDGLGMERRIGMLELPNPVYRLWSDGAWNKLILAHGCYWRRCAFCDTSLDYIHRFRPEKAERLVDRMEAIMAQTGRSGFHFVDEAAPPALLRAVAREILRRRLVVTWWGNIRFEKHFTPSLAALLAESGCLALSGGLETVCDRTLALMRKGITVEEGVRAAGALAAHGIQLHAYLMYGFPTQTARETVEALEIVRQMFEQGCLHSAFWHRFALTVHSPMAASPAEFDIRCLPMPAAPFAQNEVAWAPLKKMDDPESLAAGLRKAVYNFLHGVGFDQDVRSWFDVTVPRPRVSRRWVAGLMEGRSGAGAGPRRVSSEI